MILFWLLTSYGITQILVESTLFKPIRVLLSKTMLTSPFHTLLSCMICTGAWVSFALSISWFSPTMQVTNYPMYIYGYNTTWFADGMFGSCIIWFISRFEKLIIAAIEYISIKTYR